MGRTLLIDRTVIDQLNSGNAAVARVIKSLPPRSAIWISHELYASLNPAEQRMVNDLGVNYPNADQHYLASYRIRSDARLRHTLAMNPSALDAVTPEYEMTVASAEAHHAELMTFDTKLSNVYRQFTGARIVPEMASISAVNAPKNYNTGRQVLGLRPLLVSPDGTVHQTRMPAKPVNIKVGDKTLGYVNEDGDFIKSDGPRTKSGARTTANITAQAGDQLEPVQEYGPSAAGEAKFQGATLAFRGVNFVLQKINGAIQARRFDAMWKGMQPFVQQKLDDDPQLGALLLIYYSQAQGDAESAIEPVQVFQTIGVGYGFTPDDALRDYASRPQVGIGGNVGDKIWLKPKEPADVSRLRLPFGTTVAGLATFVPGKEKLVRVKFGGRAGFDDKMSSRETLDVPGGMTPRFYYLWPPDEVSYFDGKYITVSVGWTFSDDADESNADIDFTLKTWSGIPVVKLDSAINPSTWFGDGATAAMVWPADNSTANLFQSASPTGDNYGFLAGQSLGPMRWVRPEFIRVIKEPV
jgi:hypothetical protein